jgi:hypothetical protein
MSLVRERVWLIDNIFVTEPYLGGKLIGETQYLDMTEYNIIEKFSQEEFDKMMYSFKEENGYFPDS